MGNSRKILFRAWDEKQEIMFEYEVHGGNPIYIKLNGQTVSITRDGEEDFPGYLILLQFTGLLDKNGKEIYEGDIVRMRKGEIGKVRYDNCYFDIDRPHKPEGQWIDWPSEYFEECEIIGNIWENPELLEDKQ